MPAFPVVVARVRIPLLCLAICLFAAGRVWSATSLSFVAAGLLAIGLACYFRVGIVRRAPIIVDAPVRGRWRAVNSPADRVPSHGLVAYGQSHAVDLVHEPRDDARPSFGWWPILRRPEAFPGFGQPVLAPFDGVVVRVHGRQRDHLSRNSWPALLYLLLESARELLGPSRVLGNHLVLDAGGGVYVLLAHLRRGSLRVEGGQRVRAGQVLARCGNSGNSSEPHLHIQLMDRPNPLFAAGLPLCFSWTTVEGQAREGMPAKGEVFEVSA